MSIDQEIIPYLTDNAREALSISNFDDASIKKITGGDYNFNYHVSTEGQELLVRVNIEPQSGLDTQIEYEYGTLQFLAPYGVTPRPLFLDNSRQHLPYGLMIEEFLPGSHLQFSEQSVARVAKAMATLHTITVDGAPLHVRKNPLGEQVDAVRADLDTYAMRKQPRAELLRLGHAVVDKLVTDLPRLHDMYHPTSVIHTDPNPANILDTGNEVFFVDWEQGRVDDPSYDIAAFFSDVLNLWASPRILTDSEKQVFLDTYVAASGDTTIGERLKPRLMAYTLNAVIWAANRIADVDEGKIDANLGNQNYARYKAMSDASELEKIL